jgi:hypothetical protein
MYVDRSREKRIFLMVSYYARKSEPSLLPPIRHYAGTSLSLFNFLDVYLTTSNNGSNESINVTSFTSHVLLGL